MGTFVKETQRMMGYLVLKKDGLFKVSCNTFLVSVLALIFSFLRFISNHVCRSKVEEINGSFFYSHSKEDCPLFHESSTGFLGELERLASNENSVQTEDSVFSQPQFLTRNKYEFMSVKDVVFVQEPLTVEFAVQEMFFGEVGEFISPNDGSFDDETCLKAESLKQEMDQNPLQLGDEFTEFEEYSTSEVDKIHGFEEEDEVMEEQDFSYEIDLLPEMNQETVFSGFKFIYSPGNVNPMDSHDRGKPEDFEANPAKDSAAIDEAVLGKEEEDDVAYDCGKFDASTSMVVPLSAVLYGRLHHPCCSIQGTGECTAMRPDFTMNTEDTETSIQLDLDDEYIELEPGNPISEKISENSQLKYWDSDSESGDECEDALWEHQNLVQQMKMELRNCRIGGLPTIAEDCETPKMVEDLKPLRIDDPRFGYKDVMAEIQKFYKSYAERMRKLDILNFQTLQAMSFMQLKDSEIFNYGKKNTASILRSLHIPKIWPRKLQRVHADPVLRSIGELKRNLELVYVGQLCLSWEILLWLYVKVKELAQYDSQGIHSYNRVAEEFQQFQVLMQRFIEDESFQGPRVQNYGKNRCMIRGLLHVPMIKDDCMKDKEKKEETDSISIEFLQQIINNSMLVFQKFICSDKLSKDITLNRIKGTKIDVREHQDSLLIWDIISILHKKERKLKENIRSKGCIMKKLQKQEEESDQLVICEVELRLVSRVVGLSRLSTDQLAWCKSKLHSIKFVNRKVHLEPSFLLFPC